MSAARKIAYGAFFSALALALSWAESFLPLTLFIPVPGFRLGLANLVTLFVLYHLGGRTAFSVLTARCFLGALLTGNLTALAFSLLGGFAAMSVMAALRRSRRLSVYGVSIAGAAAHNLGQVLAAVLVLGGWAPLAYLPPLLALSVLTGAFTGGISAALFRFAESARLSPAG